MCYYPSEICFGSWRLLLCQAADRGGSTRRGRSHHLGEHVLVKNSVRLPAGIISVQWLTWGRYDILVPCLIQCGCLRSAFYYNSRAVKAFPGMASFQGYQEALLSKLRSHFGSKGGSFDSIDKQDYPDKGRVRRELYPWNEYEPDRFAPDVLSFLNGEMASIAPKLEVKVADLPLLTDAAASR